MMIHDSAPHRVFKISELTRLITSQLILISRKSAVSLACASQYLEEPVLSTLWESQRSLHTLLEVLPVESWGYLRVGLDKNSKHFKIRGDPSPEAWNRVQRYASWMHQVDVNDESILSKDTFHKLRANSPVSGWFPALQDLSWCITRSNLPHADLFFSPHLKTISISMPWAWRNSNIPHDVLPAIASIISALPVSALQVLIVDVDRRMRPSQYFKDSLSSVVLRCGPSLVEFTSTIPLSEAAVDHLIRLPHLSIWHIEGPPPSYTASSLPLAFPPLTGLTLGEGAEHGWLSLLKRLEDGGSTVQGVTPLSKVKKSLKRLIIEYLPVPIIDNSFTSPIQIFQNLVDLNVDACCGDEHNGKCTFKLNNNDVTVFAMALSRLEYFLLEPGCFQNTCATTVACLLPISVHCLKLQQLEIHFNTTNIVDDLRTISEDPKYQELRSLPRCSLNHLDAWRTPLTLDEPDFEIVANGMIDIFPSLEGCAGWGEFEGTWHGLSNRIAELREL